MTVEQLPSGSYRVRKQINGKRVTKTFDHKPTKAELNDAFANIISKSRSDYNADSFESCAMAYISAKNNVLSPSSIGEYTLKVKRITGHFRSLPVDDIDSLDIQKELNLMAARLSAKTVKDMYGFINAVLKLYQTNYKFYTVTLPKKKKKSIYIPTDEDIKKIIEASEGTQFDIAIKLGCFGLRRSEICCITADDIDGCILHINKALVQNKATKEWIVKSTKTTESERDIIIPQDMADAIIAAGKAYDGFPGSISNWLRRTQDKLNMEHFSLHKERHYFATQLMQMGISQKDIQAMGGWSTSKTLEEIYQHERIRSDREKQQAISAALFSKLS